MCVNELRIILSVVLNFLKYVIFVKNIVNISDTYVCETIRSRQLIVTFPPNDVSRRIMNRFPMIDDSPTFQYKDGRKFQHIRRGPFVYLLIFSVYRRSIIFFNFDNTFNEFDLPKIGSLKCPYYI